jgi:hypothetical protein
MTFKTLDWESIKFIKDFLYRRVASPLNHALGRLAIAEHVEEPEEAKAQFRLIRRSLEITLNLIKAWAALIHVRSGGTLHQYQRRAIAPDAFPPWLVEYLNERGTLRLEQSQPVFVHPESFYESLCLLAQVARSIGTLKYLLVSDAKSPAPGVWVRAAFEPPASGPYPSLPCLIEDLDADDPVQRDTQLNLRVLRGLLLINEARFTLQNHTQSGEQALAAWLPVREAAAQPEAPADLRPSGAVLASPPREQTAPPPDDPAQTAAPARHDLADSVLARTTHTSGPAEAPRDAVPPTSDEARDPALAEVDNRRETLIVPPPNWGHSLQQVRRPDNHASDDTGDDTPPDENRSETLIVPPPDFRQRLEQAAPPDDAAAGDSTTQDRTADDAAGDAEDDSQPEAGS